MAADTFYGTAYFTGNYAAASISMIPGAIPGPYLAGVLHDISGGYLASFLVMTGFALLALFAMHFLKKP